jgi:predicted AAA+ superfamily ATPase
LEFAVHLDHIRERRAHDDYLQPERFFERTDLTTSLMELSSQVVRRLSGIKVETSAVFNMATQFGSGKTHALTALYHLAKGGQATQHWKGVAAVLSRAQVPTVPQADVAVFVGTEFDVVDGRGGDGEPQRRTPWGEIAWQLGGAPALAVVAKHDELGTAPSGDVIRRMLPSGPVLILMDMVLGHLHLFDLALEVVSDFPQQLGSTLTDICSRDPFAILRGPHQMIFRIVDGMTGPFANHAIMISHDWPAYGRPNFSSPPTGRGFQVRL